MFMETKFFRTSLQSYHINKLTKYNLLNNCNIFTILQPPGIAIGLNKRIIADCLF